MGHVGFGATLMTATLTLFPLLGRTPPPWRWPPDVLATSFGTHVAYVSAVAAVDDGLRRLAATSRHRIMRGRGRQRSPAWVMPPQAAGATISNASVWSGKQG